jgi:hypothetical protein
MNLHELVDIEFFYRRMLKKQDNKKNFHYWSMSAFSTVYTTLVLVFDILLYYTPVYMYTIRVPNAFIFSGVICSTGTWTGSLLENAKH